MSVGKRGSLRLGAGLLVALAVLLQGCVLFESEGDAYTIPGIKGIVYSHRFSDGYYAIQIGVQPGGGRLFRYVYEGSPEYEIIERFLRNPNNPLFGAEREAVPGGAGTPPLPAVQ